MLLPPSSDDHPAARAFRDAIGAARLWCSFAHDDPEELRRRELRVAELVLLADDVIPEILVHFPPGDD